MNTFRPFTADSLPPEDTVILVRYKRSWLVGRETTATTAERNLIFPAITVYRDQPFLTDGRAFAGVRVLTPTNRHAEELTYMDGMVVRLLDGWMLMPRFE